MLGARTVNTETIVARICLYASFTVAKWLIFIVQMVKCMIKFIFEIVSVLLMGIIDKFIFYIDDDEKFLYSFVIKIEMTMICFNLLNKF